LPHAEIGEYKVIGNPIRLSGTPPSYRRPPPTLGADTDAVLRALGIAEGDIAQLRADGAI
jgi:crotonobetainyl-CoA:carnitine CoA-transferase CaiB-like acyl-CoA transferase